MANGRRGSRGRGGRGKSVAQSGGIANSYSDSKKGAGTTKFAKSGGSRADSTMRVTSNSRHGAKVNVRSNGGTANTGGSAKRGAPKALSGNPKPKVSGSTKMPTPSLRTGQIRGAGGSA